MQEMEQEFLLKSAIYAIKDGDLSKLKSIVSTIPEEKLSEIFSGKDKNGVTPIYVAVKRNNAKIVQFLLEECHIDLMTTETDDDCRKPLYLAASYGDLEIVKMLIAFGAKLNSSDAKSDCSPLHIACIHGNFETAEFLIEKGEDIDKSNCIMVVLRDEEFVQYLLERGANINHDHYGYTPLISCCKHGYLETAKILLEKGADMSKICDEGLTSLQWAALNRHESIISFLFENNLCTSEEYWDSLELLGVALVSKSDLSSAIKYWNRTLHERSKSEQIAFESVILGGLQKKINQIENYDHLTKDQENAIIHSLMILERILGYKKLPLNVFYGELLILMGMNIEFWEAILRWTSKQHLSAIFFAAFYRFASLFESHAMECNFKNIDSSMLKLFYKFIETSLILFSSKNNQRCILNPMAHPFTLIKVILCLFSIKENVEDFDIELFHTHIRKSSRNLVFPLERTYFHMFVEKIYFCFSYPDKVIYEAFELCCKLCESVDELDYMNESPLFLALKYDDNTKFVDILLKYGADTNIKNTSGVSIRERANQVGREDICIGSPSLQSLINTKLNPVRSSWKKRHARNHFEIHEDMQEVLKNMMRLY